MVLAWKMLGACPQRANPISLCAASPSSSLHFCLAAKALYSTNPSSAARISLGSAAYQILHLFYDKDVI
ncbi:hypothetical protein DM860_018033 [Cuscuta australis]|uniref:Uncharacterized protein n=1 Tax=Cuscuta australis TaxID=267555 RepID=A0A328DU36_9ASTE|nr:hypothetical protein DM860_018033 [Cuscuta australis]